MLTGNSINAECVLHLLQRTVQSRTEHWMRWKTADGGQFDISEYTSSVVFLLSLAARELIGLAVPFQKRLQQGNVNCPNSIIHLSKWIPCCQTGLSWYRGHVWSPSSFGSSWHHLAVTLGHVKPSDHWDISWEAIWFLCKHKDLAYIVKKGQTMTWM